MGNQCSFVSPQLTTAVGGAAPTFAFDATNTNYFALQGKIATASGSICTYPTASAYTPVIIEGTSTRTCSVLSGSQMYTAVNCPTVIDNQFTAGTYTLAFQGPSGYPYTIVNQAFVVALPTTATVLATSTITTLISATATGSASSTVSDVFSTSNSVSSSSSSFSSSGLSSSTVASSSVMSTLGSSSIVQSSSASTSMTVSSVSSSQGSTLASASTSASSSAVSPSIVLSSSISSGSSSITLQSSLSSSSSSAQVPSSSSSSSSSVQPSSSSGSTKVSSSASTRSNTLTTFITRTSSSASSTPTLKISPDATCGGKTGYTCKGSKFGDCCSQNGWCGRTTAYCGNGCKIAFGTCSASTLSSSIRSSSVPSSSASVKPSASPVPTLTVSSDGSCGGKTTCQGSKYGNCCSKYGYCGSSSNYCDTGCNPLFGTCKSQSVSSMIPSVPTLKVSRDAKCGGSTGQTCKGSTFGDCCSKNGWCGSSSSYCGTGCLSTFGDCTSRRLAIRDTNQPLQPRVTVVAEVSGAGPDYTYPPIPTVTIYVATVYTGVTAYESSSTLSISESQSLSLFTPSLSATDTLLSSSATIVFASPSASISADSASISPTLLESSAMSTLTSTQSSASASDLPSASAPAVPSTSAPAVPSNFCLKIVTPGTFASGWAIKQDNPGGTNGAFWIDPVVGGVHSAVSFFSIGDQNTLTVTTPGTVGTIVTGHSRGTGSMFRFTTPYSSLLTTKCTIQTDVVGYLGQQILRCIGGFASKPVHTYTGFRPGTVNDNGLHYLFGTEDFTTNTPTDFVIEFGVFTGAACSENLPMSSTVVSAASTPPVSSAELSSSDISVTPTPSPVPSPSSSVSSVELSSNDVSVTPAPSPTPSPSSIVLSSSDVASSSAVVASSAAVPSNFCLKVVSPGVRSTGWIVRQSNLDNGNYRLDPEVGGTNPYTSRFTLDGINQLISTTPGIAPGTRAGYTTSTGTTMRFFSPANTYLGVICSVKTDVPGYEGQQLLKCTGGLRGQVYTGWRQFTFISSTGEHIEWLQGTNDFTTNDPVGNFVIELGLFTGGDCPVGDVVVTPTPAASDVSAISSAIASPSSDALSSSSVIPSASSTPTSS